MKSTSGETAPEVSFVIGTYNSDEYIESCLNSVYSQNYDNFEVVVVDNNSKDETIEIIREKFPEVSLVVLPNSDYGASEMYNIAISSCSGEFIAKLDDDTEIDEDWCEKLVEKFQSLDEEIGLIQTRISEKNQVLYDEERFIDKFKACGVMFRKKALEDAGLFDEDFFIQREDFELGHRLVENGYKILVWPEVTTKHKTENLPGNGTSNFKMRLNTRNQLWIIWKYYDRKNAAISTFYRISRNLLFSLKNRALSGWFLGVFGALKKFPKYAVKERTSCKDLNYRRWTLREVLSSVKNVRKHF